MQVLEIEKEKMVEMLQQQRIQQRRVTWCPGVASGKAPPACAAAIKGRLQCKDKEMQTEPDESINSLKDEIWSLRGHLGEAKVCNKAEAKSLLLFILSRGGRFLLGTFC
ncbi:uncharacterized protein LOC141890169 [Acropora palmata]|uniref:uncharacterized protein LOC141890169 n=1 Tax=Acropora palmata TaxID=6131 RepID=UPI003DA05CFF